MNETYKLIKSFEFREDIRSLITFSDSAKIRLDPQTHEIKLARQNNAQLRVLIDAPEYPLDDDLYVKTWLANPKAVIAWAGFDWWGKQPDGTSVRFRVSLDGTTQLWHNGASWVAPAAGEWNTVQELHDAMASLDASVKKIQIIINLKTTDKTATPVVTAVAVLFDASIDFEYDLIFDSLVPKLESIRPIKDWAFELVTDTNIMRLAAGQEYSIQPFEIMDVIEAFNHDDDPDHQTNLAQSFDAGTKVLTLTSAQTAGKRIWLRFKYKPHVDVMVHQDWGVVEKIPSVIIEDMDETTGAPFPGYDYVRDRTNKTATIVHAPYRLTLRVTCRLVTDRNRDMAALWGAMMRLFHASPLLKSEGLDEEYSLILNRELNNTMNPNLSDLKQRKMIFDILDVNYWTEGDKDAGLVTTGLVGMGDMDFTSGTV